MNDNQSCEIQSKKNLIFYDIYIVKTLKIPNYSKLIPANGKDQ